MIRNDRMILVYGKLPEYWAGHEALFQRLHDEGFEIHATVRKIDKPKKTDKKLPDFAVNHGLLDGGSYQRLLSQARFFLGLGFPYEGPAPLEAVAAGAIFINPVLKPPHGRHADVADKDSE